MIKKIFIAASVLLSCGNGDKEAMNNSIIKAEVNMVAEEARAEQCFSIHERLKKENEYYVSNLHKQACDIMRQ